MSTILNYRYINALLASSGQPLADEIQSIADAGYEAVINLAMPYSPNVLEDEGFRVSIPVSPLGAGDAGSRGQSRDATGMGAG